jgi:hypothetical protein
LRSQAFTRSIVSSRHDERLGGDVSEARSLPARLVAVDDTCWFCHAPVRALAGVLVDPGLTADHTGFVGLADVAETVKLVDPAVLAAHNIGALRHRPSPGLQGGYLANGCPACDALIGYMRIEDLVRDHVAAGGTLDQLAIELTVDLLGPAVAANHAAAGRV